jgi:hypothetical protein
MIVPPRAFRLRVPCREERRTGYDGAFAPEAELDAHGGRSAAMERTALQSSDGTDLYLKQAPTPVAGAAWLLLATGNGRTAASARSPASSVNTGRRGTGGGLHRESAGTTARVQYTADYYFFTDR